MISADRNEQIENLFWNDESDDWRRVVDQLRDSEELHHAFSIYNWDSGFAFPILVLDRDDCDLGTLLYMFELVGSDPEFPLTEFAEYESDFAEFHAKLVNRYHADTYPQQISHNGSPGKQLVVAHHPPPQHYDVFPEERPIGE